MENSKSFLFQSSFGSQFVFSVLVLFILFIVMVSIETVYKAYLQMSYAKVPLYPYTGSSNKMIVIPQDPADPKAKTAYPSENEITGIEFSYSTFIYINESTYSTQTTDLRPIFHKGYKYPFPLCGPGVFALGGTNTLRIIMNSYAKWYNSVDITDVPVNKWFHLAIVCRGNSLDIYLNGNLTTKMTFPGSVPYQNYQPIVLFSTDRNGAITVTGDANANRRDIPTGEAFAVGAPINGYISNLNYYRYAISFSELQADMAAGPSKEFASDSMDVPPYLIDSWWTNRSA
jgi:hypothetical protein